MALRILCGNAVRRMKEMRLIGMGMLQGSMDVSNEISQMSNTNMSAANLSATFGTIVYYHNFYKYGMGGFREKKTFTKKLLECIKAEIEHEKETYEADSVVLQPPPNGFKLEEMEGSNIILTKRYNNEDLRIECSFVEQPVPEKENPEDPETAIINLKKVKYETNREKLGKKRPTNYVTLRDPYKNPNFKIIMRKDYVMPYKGMMHNYLGFQPWHKITDPFYDQDNVMKQEVSHTIMFSFMITKDDDDRKLVMEIETDGGYINVNHVGFENKNAKLAITDYTGPAFGELDESLQDTLTCWAEERGIDDNLGDYLVQKVHDIEEQHYVKWLTGMQEFVSKQQEESDSEAAAV